MNIGADKTKPMTNNTDVISTDIMIFDEILETVNSFKYLVAIVTDTESMPLKHSPVAQP
ncbi:hypothetical protein DPMN_164917 [Dreissena polymorpha]|uniref:Uncharacterized protein n=1 Tax=Dreissena polymorpha TaxID=45954 RepID=A0A9D4EYN8_DREPO|nr:hypothetical protein DPMN_164917 [Dreissena polymorpha]